MRNGKDTALKSYRSLCSGRTPYAGPTSSATAAPSLARGCSGHCDIFPPLRELLRVTAALEPLILFLLHYCTVLDKKRWPLRHLRQRPFADFEIGALDHRKVASASLCLYERVTRARSVSDLAHLFDVRIREGTRVLSLLKTIAARPAASLQRVLRPDVTVDAVKQATDLTRATDSTIPNLSCNGSPLLLTLSFGH